MMYPSCGSSDVAARAWTQSRRSRLELAVVPAAVRIARLWTADQLAPAGQAPGPASADLIDSAVLAVSELVTNAIQAVSRVTAAGQAPAAVIPGSTLTAPVLASSAVAGSARPPEGGRAHSAGSVSRTLPGRILSFGDLPYALGLPGSGLSSGPRLASGSGLSSGPVRQAVPARPAPPARVSLVIVRSPERVRIEVRDSSPVPLPPTCRRDVDDETGRGLTVVAALADSWGWQPEAQGKVVWCELAS
jgi:hypothetical protein